MALEELDMGLMGQSAPPGSTITRGRKVTTAEARPIAPTRKPMVATAYFQLFDQRPFGWCSCRNGSALFFGGLRPPDFGMPLPKPDLRPNRGKR